MFDNSLLRGRAAVDDEACAGHEAGVVGDDALGKAGDGAEPAYRQPLRRDLSHLIPWLLLTKPSFRYHLLRICRLTLKFG
jgi:hypothetical protein